MLRARRHELIMQIVRAEGSTTVEALAERLGSSVATIRRDLLQLDKAGQLRRVYGGAMSIDDKDEPFVEVAAVRAEEKEKVAQACAKLVKDNETILLDIGTTAARVARALRGRRITVVTSSLAVVEELLDSEETQLILLGGMLRRDYRSLVGFLTEDNLREIRADRLFLGTSGVRPGGLVMDTTVVEVPIKRAMIAASGQVVLIADAGKFPGTGMARVCGPADLDVLVTTGGADAGTLDAFRDEGVTVIEA